MLKRLFGLCMMVNARYVKWMQLVFLGAGIYNILWASWVVLFPNQLFYLTGIALPNHIWLWQAIGM